MAAKTENYSAALTGAVVGMYEAGETVEAIATFAGKTTRSIIAKLSRVGVYKAKEYTTKKGEKPIAKEVLVAKIADKAGFAVDQAGGLEKANKQCLINILAALNRTA